MYLLVPTLCIYLSMDEVDKHSNITKAHRRQAYNVPKKEVEVGHHGL